MIYLYRWEFDQEDQIFLGIYDDAEAAKAEAEKDANETGVRNQDYAIIEMHFDRTLSVSRYQAGNVSSILRLERGDD